MKSLRFKPEAVQEFKVDLPGGMFELIQTSDLLTVNFCGAQELHPGFWVEMFGFLGAVHVPFDFTYQTCQRQLHLRTLADKNIPF